MNKCAFAACSDVACELDEILRDGIIFRCCSDHHEAIAKVIAENASVLAAAELKRKGVIFQRTGEVDRMAEPEVEYLVYFMRRENGDIKIGFSGDVDRRRRQLESHFGSLEILHVEAGGFAREKELHKQFKEFRADGEWFRPDEELVRYLELSTTSLDALSTEEVDDDGPIYLD